MELIFVITYYMFFLQLHKRPPTYKSYKPWEILSLILKKAYDPMRWGEHNPIFYERKVETCHETGGSRCPWNVSNKLRDYMLSKFRIAEQELLICIAACTEFNFHHKILPAQASDLHRYWIGKVA